MTHRRRQNLYALPTAQWQILSEPPISLLDTLNAVDDAIDQNADIAEEILALGLQAFGLPEEPAKGSIEDWRGAAKPSDIAKAHSTIRQFYRDWSEEGNEERQACNGVALRDLEQMIGKSTFHGNVAELAPRFLIPGAGLGRFVVGVSLAGYNAEGNEISYHQLLASNWILNHTRENQRYHLFPFVSQFTNVLSRRNQFQQVIIPDLHPGKTFAAKAEAGLPSGQMDMTAADFVVLYGDAGQRETFDAVVTVFFIDTAPNFIRYIRTIYNCLKDNGVWINVGPLLWHFDDRAPDANDKGADSKNLKAVNDNGDDKGVGEPGSFELSNEEVLLLIERKGFKVEHQEILPGGMGYVQDRYSMIQNLYQVSHWIARKVS